MIPLVVCTELLLLVDLSGIFSAGLSSVLVFSMTFGGMGFGVSCVGVFGSRVPEDPAERLRSSGGMDRGPEEWFRSEDKCLRSSDFDPPLLMVPVLLSPI